MGQLSFPPSARVYLDTAPLIYSVERHAEYWSKLRELWRLTRAKEIEVVTSELALLETGVQPIRQNNQPLITAYKTLLTRTEIVLVPITADILLAAAVLRALQNLKTPDAIHAATAHSLNCDFFVTNDDGVKRLENIDVVILSELL